MLRDDRYRSYLESAPMFCGYESLGLVEHLRARTLEGDDGDLLGRVIEDNFRPSKALKYFNNFTDVAENSLDVIICDDAHRIRSTSNNRFMARERRSDLSQID
jgi:hypothetical protein